MKFINAMLMIVIVNTFFFSCKSNIKNGMSNIDKQSSMVLMKSKKNFQKVIQGDSVKLFLLKNRNGMEATFTNYGQRLVSLLVPDKHGKFEDIVLGFSTLDEYMNSKEKYFGAIIGRYGNRIAQGQFTLNNEIYQLPINNKTNHIHGGTMGFNSFVWKAYQLGDSEIEFVRTSPDMEEGYPGNLIVKVHYKLTDENELKINYEATSDKLTIINLTHHSFFNLKGEGNGDILNHYLMINADYFTPINESMIPTGEIVKVGATPFDFTEAKTIGKDIDRDNLQLKIGKGYDHNFVLKNEPKNKYGLVFAARVTEPASGRIMEVYTDEPGIQLYTSNFLDGSTIGKNEKRYVFRGAFCLETQHFPDSPNHTNFPSTILNPKEKYESNCVYKFTTL